MLTRHYTTLPLQSVIPKSSSHPDMSARNLGGGYGGASGGPDPAEGMFQKKRKVIHFVLRWCVMALHEFSEDPSLISFLNASHSFCNSMISWQKSPLQEKPPEVYKFYTCLFGRMFNSCDPKY